MKVGLSMWKKVCDGGRWRNTKSMGSGVVDAWLLGSLGIFLSNRVLRNKTTTRRNGGFQMECVCAYEL